MQALSAGQAGAYDRLRQPIQPGGKVLWSPPYDLIFDVAAVAPVLDPGAPAGLMNVTVTVTATVQMYANQPNVQMLMIPALGGAARAQGDGDHDDSEQRGEAEEEGGRVDADPRD